MTYDPDELSARREQVKAKSTRARLTAVVVLALGFAGVGIAFATSGSDSQQQGAVGSAVGDRSARPATQAQRSIADWRKPLSTPQQEAAAVARLAKIGKPVYCGGGRVGRYVALTFDDGPGAYTHFAIRKLKQWKARATFFVVGDRLRDPSWEQWAKRETYLAAIADHSWTHPYLPGLDLAGVRTEIGDTKSLAEQVTATKVQVFRPPYGARNASIDQITAQLGLAEIIWDVDSADSLGANYAGIERNVIAGLKPGAIILMHENRGQTIRALPTILPQLKKKHLTAVTVPELLALDPPTQTQLNAGANGCGSLRGNGGPAPSQT